MEPIRERIHNLMRCYWYEGKRVFRVVAVAVLIGAILVVGAWPLPNWLTIPRVSTEGPVV